MKTIAIISQKGGAGKTTLAVHLAIAATLGSPKKERMNAQLKKHCNDE